MFTFLTCALIVIVTVNGDATTAPPSEDCDDLTEAMTLAFWNFLVEANTTAATSKALSQMRHVTGVDFQNQEEVHNLACKLAGVTSLHELADQLPISYDELYRLYEENLFMLQMMGGIHGYRAHMSVMSNLLDGALRVGFPKAKLPLAAPVNDVTIFLRHMVNEYGPNFLTAVNFDLEPLIVSDPAKLASDLTTSQSVNELAERTGFPVHTVHAIWARLGYEIENNAYRWEMRADESLLYFLDVCEHLGLLELQP